MFSKKNVTKRVLAATVSMIILGLVLAGCGAVTTTADNSMAVPTNTPDSLTASVGLPTVTPMPSSIATVTPEPTFTEATATSTTSSVGATTVVTTIAPINTAATVPATATAQAQPTFPKPIILTVGAATVIRQPPAKPLPTPLPQPTASSNRQAVNLFVEQAIALAKQTLNHGNNEIVGTADLASYFPDTPGTKLTNFSKCKEQSKAGNVSACGSNVLGTTTATNDKGTWYIDFTLVWPGTVVTKMKIAQATHSWRLAVSPDGQATLLSESGATLPTF